METGADVEVTFAREPLLASWREALPLALAHNAETGLSLPLKPDTEMLLAMERAGALVLYTMRDGSELVGYALFGVALNALYGEVMAFQYALYVAMPYRGMPAMRFMRWQDAEIAALEGVRYIMRNVRPQRDYSRALVHMGYEERERGYIRRIS